MFEAALALAMIFLPGVEGKIESGNLQVLAWLQAEESVESQSVSEDILSAAKRMVDLQTDYRFSFPTIEYPFGDVPSDWGLCCDVVVRACRAAGIDLQELVYEDSHRERELYIEANRRQNFARPLNRSWIHRRTSNLNLFLQRYAQVLPTRYDSTRPEEWQPGDIVIYQKYQDLTWHIAIVSDEIDSFTGIPKVIDAWLNPGHVSEDHRLTDHGAIGGHYRITDSFRASLSEEHREAAIAAWKEFIGDEDESDQRLAESTEEIEPSSL
ncbi:MAG: DUF1287 domain-containing protein [Candidatus Omnitrophica bacterium]|nr:DUF1287 domain-containing protein [Candidatus Omnitrophota bacterium]